MHSEIQVRSILFLSNTSSEVKAGFAAQRKQNFPAMPRFRVSFLAKHFSPEKEPNMPWTRSGTASQEAYRVTRKLPRHICNAQTMHLQPPSLLLIGKRSMVEERYPKMRQGEQDRDSHG